MSGYVPVPHKALEAVEIDGWHAVMDLYKRAHALRWASFQITERSLMTRWNMSNRKVWNLLGELEAHGFLTIERGTKREQSRVTVVCPTSEVDNEPRQSARHNTRQSARQNNDHSSDGVEIPAAQVAAHRAAQPAAPSTRPETEPEPNPRPKKTDVPDWARKLKPPNVTHDELVATVVAAATEMRQQPPNVAKLGTFAGPIAALIRASGTTSADVATFADDLVLVIRCARESADPTFARNIRAEGWPEGTDRHLDITTICKSDAWDGRLAAARKPKLPPSHAGKHAHDWAPPAATGPPDDANEAALRELMEADARRAIEQQAEEERRRREFEAKVAKRKPTQLAAK